MKSESTGRTHDLSLSGVTGAVRLGGGSLGHVSGGRFMFSTVDKCELQLASMFTKTNMQPHECEKQTLHHEHGHKEGEQVVDG
jgi:hypothetical protein